MSAPTTAKGNDPLKLAGALLFQALVIVFFIVPLFSGSKASRSRRARRGRSYAQRTVVDSKGRIVRRAPEIDESDLEENQAESADLLRIHGSWTAKTKVKEVFLVLPAPKEGEGH